MPTPLLHGAAGAAVVGLARPVRRRVAGLMILAALLPDIDLVPGLLIGDPNRFHNGWTHSLVFAAMVSIGLAQFVSTNRRWAMLWIFLAGASHPVLDGMTVDGRPPYGTPLFWPVSQQTVHFGSILPGVRHGADGATTDLFLTQVFSWENVKTVGVESVVGSFLIVVGAAAGAAISYRRRSRILARER